MTKLEREIEIDAPRERVYDVLADPGCLEKWVTIQEELEDDERAELAKSASAVEELVQALQKV